MNFDPPKSEEQLWQRARDLAGRTIGELGEWCGQEVPTSTQRAKGFVGTLVERCLGGDAGNADGPDFAALCVELKTIPVTRKGRPKESTFVSSISLGDADSIEWRQSRVLRKLRRVLWVPVESDPRLPLPTRRVGHPVLWSPTTDQEAMLRHDWEELMGLVGSGQLEQITAHLGEVLQVRPKAASSRVRTTGIDAQGFVRTLPLGFYLRSSFTAQIIAGAK